MRLTLDLLSQAPQTLNPASQRQLLLRGLKIPTIENLGSTNDAFECMDFCDNDLIKLGNFPPLKRLKVLLLMNNRISRIAEDCFDPLPNMVSVTLTGNRLEKLVDLEPLTKIKTLERLCLLDNPVTKVKHYRPYMISKCSKTLRILDFNRIKEKERKAASLLFAGERGKKLLEEIAPPRAAGKDISEKQGPEIPKTGPTPEVIERIKKAIAEAETIEEVTRLERALKMGVLPDELKQETVTGPAPTQAKAPPPTMPTPAPALQVPQPSLVPAAAALAGPPATPAAASSSSSAPTVGASAPDQERPGEPAKAAGAAPADKEEASEVGKKDVMEVDG